MRHATDLIGRIDIDPVLNQPEIDYLAGFARTRRFDRDGGPYVVPTDPDAESAGDHGDAFQRPAPEQPELWCPWAPAPNGRRLVVVARERFYAPVGWLRYLILHFLKPGAILSRSGLPGFEEFTFDHRLDGMVVGCGDEDEGLFAITATDNRVTTKSVGPRQRVPSAGRHYRALAHRAPDNVIDLAARRASR